MDYRGFSLIEFAIAIALVGAVAAVGVSRFIQVGEKGHINHFEATVGAFRSAIHLAHEKWVAQGRVGPTIVMEGQNVNMTTQGWPGFANNNRRRCLQTWNQIFSSPPPANSRFVIGREGYGVTGNRRYCWYGDQSTSRRWRRYFRYNIRNGDVRVVIR